MSSLSRRALLAGIAAAVSAPAFAKSRLGGRTIAYDGVQAFLDGYVSSARLPGAMVAIQRPDGPPLILKSGRIDPDPAAPAMDERAVVRIYSMTKPITGIAAMQLIDDGRLALDQPIADILPEYAAPKVLVDDATGATRPAASPITIRHLLTHTAGLGYSVNAGTPLARRYVEAGLTPGARTRGPGEGPTPESLQAFAARLATQPLGADPGTRWTYSVSLDLLGAIIERVAGAPFQDVLRTRIFEPLGMTDTAFFAGPAQQARLTSVVGVAPTGVRVLDPRAASPFSAPAAYPSGGGGLVSTAADYARFCQAILGGGAIGRTRILSREGMRRATSNLAPPGVTAEGRGHGFGAGMRVVRVPQPLEEPAGSVGWGGAAGTTFWVDLDARVAVIFMAQFYPSMAYGTAAEVRRAFYTDRAGPAARRPG
ncbi:MAG: beta-lactamase family protein [Alphaproteobacteria bacterium]|nr:beta-lactamase family protein [Alphaproteobacteria bacterium]